ncbi:MAG TPA: DNA mismatch endonuclease Vsr [Terriglobales bacterium]|nr:DNA mismatch endonuclease Vsr [Terriglobales bacterium]
MVDKLTKEHRSENMRRIHSKGMKPELLVRKLAHKLGYRFRLHRPDLPGRPDLVFPGRRKIIFVHGCFWHGHDDPNCIDGRRKPKSNLEYWLPKLARNKERDAANEAALIGQGWAVLTIWECDLRKTNLLAEKLKSFLN